MAKQDGGPAFPQLTQLPDGQVSSDGGASLRDWFAGQAMHKDMRSMIAPETDTFEKLFAVSARRCYEFADAMLKAREE